MRLVLAGTPETAVPSLLALLASRHEVVAVVTRPDARGGRGRTLAPSPGQGGRARARPRGADAPDAPRPGVPRPAAAIAPDCCPVVAYGALVPRVALDVPAHGWVNLHFSLLPAWRGAAPVQRALMAGDEVTGATTFVLEEGLDTGPVLGTLTETVRPDDTAGDPARPAGPRRRRPARRDDGRPRGRVAARRAAAGGGRQPRAQAHHRGGPRALEPSRPTSSTATCAAAPRPGRLDDLPRRAGQGRTGADAVRGRGSPSTPAVASRRASCT